MLLILGEPTNDLDIETLELLERIIADYQGTVILVSHDREFVDNTATSVLLFEGEGIVTEIVEGFNEINHYLAQQQGTKEVVVVSEKRTSKPRDSAVRKKKLSYKLQRELEQLPEYIATLEEEQKILEQQTLAPEFYLQPHTETAPILERLAELENELMAALERWDELENLQQESS